MPSGDDENQYIKGVKTNNQVIYYRKDNWLLNKDSARIEYKHESSEECCSDKTESLLKDTSVVLEPSMNDQSVSYLLSSRRDNQFGGQTRGSIRRSEKEKLVGFEPTPFKETPDKIEQDRRTCGVNTEKCSIF